MSHHAGNRLVDPHKLFDQVQLRTGMHVADFGCGRTGHIIFPAAMIVGNEGVVYGVDVMKDVLDNVQKRADLEAFVNVHTIWSNLEHAGMTAIPAGSLDVVFIVNMLSQAKEQEEVLKEAQRLLKPKGYIVVADWTRKGLSFAPADEQFIDFTKIKSWARSQHFGIQNEFAVGPYHHALILYRNT